MSFSVDKKRIACVVAILAVSATCVENGYSQTRHEPQTDSGTVRIPGQLLLVIPVGARADRIALLQADHYEITWRVGKVPAWIPTDRILPNYVTPEELVDRYHSIREDAEHIVLYGTNTRKGAVVFLTEDPAFAEVQQLRDRWSSDIYTLLDFNQKLADPSLRIKPIGEVTAAGLEEVDGQQRLSSSQLEEVDGQMHLVVWRAMFRTGERTRRVVPPGKNEFRPFASPF